MAWIPGLVVLQWLLVFSAAESEFNSTQLTDSFMDHVALWLQQQQDMALEHMNSHWTKAHVTFAALSHDTLDFTYRDNSLDRRSSYTNASSSVLSKDSGKSDGGLLNFPYAFNRQATTDTDVHSATVVEGASTTDGLLAKKALRQRRRRRERRRRKRCIQQNHTDPLISESGDRGPVFGVLLTAGSSLSALEGTPASTGPLWLGARESRGIRSSFFSTGDSNAETESSKRWNCDWTSSAAVTDKVKKKTEILRTGRMHGKKRMTEGRKGKGRNKAGKQLEKKRNKKENLSTELFLQQYSQKQ